MQLQGQYTLPAPLEQVWETLLDPDALAYCLPGNQELRAVGPDEYEATLSVGVAAIRGLYKGKIRVTDKQRLKSYRLEVQGGGSMGAIAAQGRVEIEPVEDKTLVRYSGDYQVAGAIAGIGQRLFQPVAQMLTTQFFRCMEQRLLSGLHAKV